MTAMTPNEIVTRVKRTFGDESGVQVTDDDILRWINDAQREAAMQVEGLLRTSATINTVADSGTYTVPSGLLALHDVAYKGVGESSYHKLRYMGPNEMDDFVDGWDGTEFSSSDPMVYSRGHASDTFVVFPRPSAVVTAGLKVEYTRYPASLATLAGTIDLPEYLHLYVLEYCLMKAYEMDEDWEAADKKASYIQSTLDFNNQRDAWFGQQSYPVVGTTTEDYY